MNDDRFDALARILAAPRSRRGALKTLAAGAGGLLALLGIDSAAAKRRGRCRLVGADCVGNPDCCSGQCCGGMCCGTGESCCDEVCINPRTDPANCGRCGHACAAGEICSGEGKGQCGPCPAGQTFCNGACLDTGSDPVNCGGCGTVCSAQERCVGGACRCCQRGSVSCGGVSTDQVCCDYPQSAFLCCPSENCDVGGCVVGCYTDPAGPGASCSLDNAPCPASAPYHVGCASAQSNGCST